MQSPKPRLFLTELQGVVPLRSRGGTVEPCPRQGSGDFFLGSRDRSGVLRDVSCVAHEMFHQVLDRDGKATQVSQSRHVIPRGLFGG